MPTFNVVINVNANQANAATGQVKRSLKSVDAAAQKTRDWLLQMMKAQDRQALAAAKVVQRMVREEEKARARIIQAAERQGIAIAKANKKAADAAVKEAHRAQQAQERAMAQDARALRALEKEQARVAAGAARDSTRKAAKQQEEWNRQMVVGAAAMYALQRGITIFAELSDEYQGIQNRLRQVTSSQGELGAAMQTTFDIAQRSRTDWATTAELYTRVRRATAEYGYTTKDAARSTETLNKIVAMSGANLEESRAALYQFSQALASNRLGGDEFRSVLEQMPDVIRVMARHLGVTVGEMRALAKAGKLTSQVMMDSLAEAAEETDRKFAKMTPTIAQSMVTLRNAVVKGIGEFAQSSGIARGLADSIAFLRSHIDTVLPIVIALAKAIGVFLAQRAITGAIAAFESLKASMVATAATPMGWITIVAAGLAALSTAVPAVGDAFVSMTQKVGQAMGKLYEFGNWLSSQSGAGGLTLADEANKKITIETLQGRGATARGTALNEGKITLQQWQELIVKERERQQIFRAGAMTTDEYIAGFKDADEELSNYIEITDAATKATDDFHKQLDKLMEGLFPIRKAQQDLTDNTILLFRAMAEGKLSIQEYTDAVLKLQETTLDARQPGEALFRSISRNVELLKMPEKQRAYETKYDQYSQGLQGKGYTKEEADAVVRNMKGVIDEEVKLEQAAKGAGKAHKKAAKDIKEAMDSWKQLLDSLYPLIKAYRDLREAEKTTADATKHGWADQEQASKVMTRYVELHRDALDPIGAINRALDEELSTLSMADDVRESYNKHMDLANQLTALGITLSEAENKALHDKIDAIVELQRIKGLEAALPLAPNERPNGLGAEDALGFAKITSIFEKDQGYDQAARFIKENPTRAAMAEMAEQTLAVNETFSIMQIGVKGLQDALVELATTGKLSFRSLVDAMIADLARLAAEQFIGYLIGLASGGWGGTAMSALHTVAGGSPNASLLGHHSAGASFMVGGGGGVDSQMVAFRASPWERVTVSNPEAQKPAPASGEQGGSGGSMALRIVNQMDRRDWLDALDSPQGERKVINILSRRRGAAGGVMR